MNKEINYPIKYAVLELKKQGGWLVGYKDITQGFIVSKCYVVESNIVYHYDGSSKITHKVVFPFQDMSYFQNNGKINLEQRNMPSYDVDNKPYPVNIVTDLFDSYEEAKIVAEAKNEEYKHNVIVSKELKKDLELCYLFEKLVLEETKNMEPDDKQKVFFKALEQSK